MLFHLALFPLVLCMYDANLVFQFLSVPFVSLVSHTHLFLGVWGLFWGGLLYKD